MKQVLFFIALLLVITSCNDYPTNRAKVAHDTRANEVEAVINELLQGNIRFSKAAQIHPDEKQSFVKSLAVKGQHPKAVIISCSDSRVPPELIFDQGFGDLFVIRNAGNILSGIDVGSVEYAVEHLGVGLIIVMGHEQCGALNALIQHDVPHGHIKDIIDSLSGEQEIQQVKADSSHLAESLVKANAKHGIRILFEQSSIIRELVKQHKLFLKAAYYNMQLEQVVLLN